MADSRRRRAPDTKGSTRHAEEAKFRGVRLEFGRVMSFRGGHISDGDFRSVMGLLPKLVLMIR